MEIATSSDTALNRTCNALTSPLGDKLEGEELSEGREDKTMMIKEVTSRGSETKKIETIQRLRRVTTDEIFPPI